MPSAQPIVTPIAHPTAVPTSRLTAVPISRTTPPVQRTAVPATAPSAMNLARPSPPRTNPNNLLAGGRVIEERKVDASELLSSGKLIEAPPERDQASRPVVAPIARR